MRRVVCPHCGQRFRTHKPDSGNFALQGSSGGRTIIKCGECGNGMLVGLIGKVQPIPAEAWAQHQAYMWEAFDSPEAQARFAAELEGRLSLAGEEQTPAEVAAAAAGGDVEAYFRNHSPEVSELWRRWKRNRSLFDETGGLAVGREIEFALRSHTDQARAHLEEADRQWSEAGHPTKGHLVRRWQKCRTAFLRAMYDENREYEGTLLYRQLDPDDDEGIQAFLDAFCSDE